MRWVQPAAQVVQQQAAAHRALAGCGLFVALAWLLLHCVAGSAQSRGAAGHGMASPCCYQNQPCGCQNQPCGCPNQFCGCQNPPCGCQNPPCDCQAAGPSSCQPPLPAPAVPGAVAWAHPRSAACCCCDQQQETRQPPVPQAQVALEQGPAIPVARGHTYAPLQQQHLHLPLHGREEPSQPLAAWAAWPVCAAASQRVLQGPQLMGLTWPAAAVHRRAAQAGPIASDTALL